MAKRVSDGALKEISGTRFTNKIHANPQSHCANEADPRKNLWSYSFKWTSVFPLSLWEKVRSRLMLSIPDPVCTYLFFGILHLPSQGISLALYSLLSSLTGCLGLRAFGIHLIFQDSLTLFFGFGLVNLVHRLVENLSIVWNSSTYMFNKSSLVLKGVTLA